LLSEDTFNFWVIELEKRDLGEVHTVNLIFLEFSETKFIIRVFQSQFFSELSYSYEPDYLLFSYGFALFVSILSLYSFDDCSF